MAVRMATVAGKFYQADAGRCLAQLKSVLAEKPVSPPCCDLNLLPDKIIAGVVPHAGWLFSGNLAGMVFNAIQQRQKVDTFVIFGAVHSLSDGCGILYDQGKWATPLGNISVDEQLAEAILAEGGNIIKADCSAHSREHSIEVQIPFIQYLFSEAKIVPLMVPPIATAAKIGIAVSRAIQRDNKNVVCIASSDLTHYGPSYGLTHMGTNDDALTWAKQTNDMFFINLALTMQADKLVDSAGLYHNSCGAGAVAAAVAVAGQAGVKKGHLLAHTTSAEVIADKFGQPTQDSVGYAAIVYG